jgi:hypothetical protein
MLSHIATDLHSAYLEEVFKPQLGKPGASTPKKSKPVSSDLDNDGDVDTFEKKVRQFIYDVRHLMKRNNIPLEKAFQMRSSKTNYGADVIKTAKEKLGIKVGGSVAVSEESETRMVYVTINYQNGTVDKRNVPYDEISRLRSKPTVRSVEISSNRSKNDYDKSRAGKLDPVGQEDGDINNDGKSNTKTDKYLSNRRNVRSNAIKNKKTYGVSEGFSDWRQDLKEVLGVADERASRNEKQIKEKKVDNYADKTINLKPEVTEKISVLGGYVVESVELDESYFDNAIELATEFFYNFGLNENGVEIVIEELGKEKFVEWVFDIAEDSLLIERKLKPGETVFPARTRERITGKPISRKRASNLKGGAATTKKTADEKRRSARKSTQQEPEPTERQKVLTRLQDSQRERNIERAKETQAPSSQPDKKRSIKDTIARGVLSAWEGHKEAMKTRKSGGNAGEAIRRGLSAASGAFKKQGTAHFREWITYLIDEGYDLSDWTFGELQEEFNMICEKAESEQQQKLFGLALSVKRGETPRSEASAEVLKIVDSMSEKKIRDFAKTKHEGIPKKVDEAIVNPKGSSGQKSPRTTRGQQSAATISLLQKLLQQSRLREDLNPTTPQQIKTQKELSQVQGKVAKANQQALKKIEPPETSENQNQSYEMEGEMIDERARSRKGQPRPNTKDPAWRAMRIVKDAQNPEGMMTRSGGTVAQHRRRRGVPGRYEPPGQPKQTTPMQRLARKKAKPTPSREYENDVYSRDGLGGIRGYRSGD